MFSFSIRALLHKGSSYSRLVSALFGEIRKIEVGVQSFQLSKKSLQRRFSFSFGDSEPEGFLGASISSMGEPHSLGHTRKSECLPLRLYTYMGRGSLGRYPVTRARKRVRSA
jgi:hypothetical protein